VSGIASIEAGRPLVQSDSDPATHWIGSDEVERIARPRGKAAFEKFVARGKPVIITGAMADWPALKQWTDDYLKSLLSDEVVLVAMSTSGNFFPGFSHAASRTIEVMPMPFGDAADLILNSSSRYYYVYQLPSSARQRLAATIRIPDFVDHDACKRVGFWFGSRGNISQLHYDWKHNLLAQVVGVKRLCLYAPRHIRDQHPYPARTADRQYSQVEIDRPDLKQFPCFSQAVATTCLLHPGEMICIPIHWWHQVYSLDVGVSVNLFWKRLLERHFSWPALRWLLTRPGSYVKYFFTSTEDDPRVSMKDGQ
jgi:hypothetical protein